MVIKTIAASKFREKCLAILDQLDSEGIVVTKHGKPVAKVVPIGRTSEELIGSLRDLIQIHGDIESTGARWDGLAES